MSSPFEALLCEPADSEACVSLLTDIGFDDTEAAHARLAAVAVEPDHRRGLTRCLPMLMTMLRDAPSPDASLVNFERFVLSVQDRSELFDYLARHPRAIEILVRLFVGSQFLTEILIQNPHYLRELTVHSRIADLKSLPDFLAEARATTVAAPGGELDALRRFQKWELLRIGACDAFGLMDLRAITRQLSLLAEAVVQTAIDLLAAELDFDPSGFSVVAMGKLGGGELNYSSDIDLIFVCLEDASRYWQLGQRLIVALTESSANGFLYRVDMRLRPWGSSGALVNTVSAYIDYLDRDGALWEKQALLKARVVAGDRKPGRELITGTAPSVYTASPPLVREAILSSRQNSEAELVRSGSGWGDVKSGPGSIRDIEFTAQYLQLVNGGLVSGLRAPNTLDALVRLAELDFIHADEYRILTDAYVLLRTIEHSLQLMHSQQAHRLPQSERRLGWMARRLGFLSTEQLREHFDECISQVRRIFNKYVRDGGSARMPPRMSVAPVAAHRKKMGRTYADAFSEDQIAKHALELEQLTDEMPVSVTTDCLKGDMWRVTVIGRDHPGCLSIITGMMLAHGIDVVDGHVFTGIRTQSTPGRARRFVDSFNVRCLKPDSEAVFCAFADELTSNMRRIYSGEFEDVATGVLRKVSRATANTVSPGDVLFAVDIEIDNDSDPDRTVLSIESTDTLGFLYELTNALAVSRLHIEQVEVSTRAGRIFDTLHITRADGTKVTDERQLQQLRAAIVLIKHFTHLLPRSPDPRRAMRQFREFLEDLLGRDDWVEQLSSLRRTDVLDALARLLGVSTFLWMDFLRLQHENLFPVLRDIERLESPRSRDALAEELRERLSGAGVGDARAVLNAFKDREMFRVDMRHILGRCSGFTQFAAELTDVADVVVESAVEICRRELVARYGVPRLPSGEECQYSVCALGKCGGRELGYASDIELMFVYEGAGETSGPERVSNSVFVEKLTKRFTQAIEARVDGIFEIDLRLRPYGQAGSPAVALDAFENYFGPDGAAWPFERQALVKLRPVAGSRSLGETVASARDRIVYSGKCFDRTAMRAMRENQIRQLVAPGTVNAKLSAGGLVDCEYLVQALQMQYGATRQSLRVTNTRAAIDALRHADILEPDDHHRLRSAHSFLRRLINALRVVRGNARDLTVPVSDPVDFPFLARQLGYDRDVVQFEADFRAAFADASDLVRRLL